jgi:hypothetical protein
MHDLKVIESCMKFEETLANLIEHQRAGERKFLRTEDRGCPLLKLKRYFVPAAGQHTTAGKS